MLHFTFPANDEENYPYPFIGDVHPFYDQKTQKWYMYYLDTSGQFNSKLLTSTDGVTWIENTDFWIHSSLANYGVLNVFERNGNYYSYYAEYQASVSTDLINWHYAGGEYQIPQDKTQFPGGMRDPSVTFDEETMTYYAIGLNYPRRIPAENIYESNLAITKSIGEDQLSWEPHHNKVFANNPINQDFECPQLMKIGRRWYVVASQYGNSIHGVGRTSYLIGDIDKNPYEVNWQSKQLHHLSTEDLCAAQIARKDDKFYLFGWIPRYYNTGFWGGYINLPTEVYPLDDGTLATRLDQNLSGKITGDQMEVITAQSILSKGERLDHSTFKRFDNTYTFSMSAAGKIEISQDDNNYRIVATNTTGNPKIELFSGSYKCFEYTLRVNALNGDNILRVIGEGKNLEIVLNDTYVLTGRIAESLSLAELSGKDTVTSHFICLEGAITVKNISSNKLKYLNDIR